MQWKTLLFGALGLIALPAGAERTVPAADAGEACRRYAARRSSRAPQ